MILNGDQKQHSPNNCPSSYYATVAIDQLLAEQRTNIDTGLSFDDVEYRRRLSGPNELTVEEEEPIWEKFAEQFKNPLIMLLFGSAAISLLLQEIKDAISIALAILIVVTVAFVQEYRSEQSLKALNKLVPHYCHVIRQSRLITILASELVPGDIVQFRTGDRIPADVRLVQVVDLEIDESNLTGETKPAKKHSKTVEPTIAAHVHVQDQASQSLQQPLLSQPQHQFTILPLAERKNVAFMGTLVRHGHAKGVVIGTGKQTEFGAVFHMMKEVETRKTPLQNNMDELGKQLSFLSFGIIGLIMVVGLLQRKNVLEMFNIGVSLAVAAIPEGLPIVVTVTLALGVLRMANRSCIIKKLPSVESLGCVNVVCVDKTGTLTLNKMTVAKIYTAADGEWCDLEEHLETASPSTPKSILPPSPIVFKGSYAPNWNKTDAMDMLLRIGNVCNNAHLDLEKSTFVGQPTEVALLELLEQFGLRDDRQSYVRVSEIPFSFERKWMAVQGQSQHTGSIMYYAKGALESILDKCSYTYRSPADMYAPLTPDMKETIRMRALQLSSKGLRVLGFACGIQLDPELEGQEVIHHHDLRSKQAQSGQMNTGLCFVGFVGMHDPPRPRIGDVIETLTKGGVQVVMITGDSEGTAVSIATRLGIKHDRTSHELMSGSELEQMDERQLTHAVGNVAVFYRTTPKHKMAIVKAFQARGAVVAMTGDGVNDAPALRLADIGISMGIGGTDVSKEAADMILVNDDFETVLYAIEEGKSIFYNIQNFLRFQLSTSISALTLIALSTLLNLPSPLNPMQILWINIICDGPVAQSLGVEPVDPNVMKKPPRSKDAPMITRDFLYRMLQSAFVIVVGTLYVYRSGLIDGQVTKLDSTMTFTTFVFFDMFNSLACRSKTRSIFELGLGTNRMHLLAVGLCVLGQLLLVYVSFFQAIFQTEAIPFWTLVYITIVSSTVLWVDEGRKYYFSKLGKRSLNGEMYHLV